MVAHAHHVHVEAAVAVVVGHHRHARPAARPDAGGRRCVDVGAATLIAQEALTLDARQPEVGVAVVVGVEEHQAGAGERQLSRYHVAAHVDEGAVGVVAVQTEVIGAEQRHVLEAVAIDVGDGGAGAGDEVADQPEDGRAGGVVHVVQTGLVGGDGEVASRFLALMSLGRWRWTVVLIGSITVRRASSQWRPCNWRQPGSSTANAATKQSRMRGGLASIAPAGSRGGAGRRRASQRA